MKTQPTTFTILASTGAEIGEDFPTWGYITGDSTETGEWQFEDQVDYIEGDEIEDAVARFQNQGKIPRGEFSVETTVGGADSWVHEDHQCSYLVMINP